MPVKRGASASLSPVPASTLLAIGAAGAILRATGYAPGVYSREMFLPGSRDLLP